MSLLDQFAILFDTDADDAADSIERLSDSLDDTEGSARNAARGVDNASDSAVRGSESFSGLAGSVGGLIAAYLSWQAISSAVFGQALATDDLGKFTETVGMSIEEVDAWGSAVTLNGGSIDSFRSSVQSLNSAMGDVAMGGGGEIVEVLGRLGISALDSAGKIREVNDLLPELADSFQGLSRSESVAFGQRLGLDQGTIMLLQQGRDAVEGLVEQQRQMGGRTQEGYEASAKFNDSLHNMRRMFVGAADTANQKILPVLTFLLDKFQVIYQWVQDHQTFVVGFFVAVAAIIAAAYLPAMTAAAAATIAATWPFLAIGAAIAGVSLIVAALYEDVKAYLGGQESFVGSLAEKYSWFGTLLDGIINGVKFLIGEFAQFGQEMFANLSNAVEFLGEVFGSIFGQSEGALSGFGETAEMVVDAVIAAFQMLGQIISGVLGFIASPIETTRDLIDGLMGMIPDLQWIGDMAGNAWGTVTGWLGGGDDEELEEVQRLQRQSEAALAVSGQANANPMLSGAGAPGSRVSYVNQSNQYSTSVDARGMDREQAASVFGDELTRQIATSRGNLDDGVAY